MNSPLAGRLAWECWIAGIGRKELLQGIAHGSAD